MEEMQRYFAGLDMKCLSASGEVNVGGFSKPVTVEILKIFLNQSVKSVRRACLCTILILG